MAENIDLNNELISLYEIISKEIPKDKIQINFNTIQKDIKTDNAKLYINHIKESFNLIINKNKELENHYTQLESTLMKLEIDIKYYIKNYMRYKILKDALEMKLNAYMGLEEEYEELKEKVKYEGGKFLENDRKDNEIIILRRENSTLKKEISKLENKNKKIENKNNEYIAKITDLESIIESLNTKILQLEKTIKENTIKNKNIIKNLNYNNSCSNLCSLNNENSLIKLDSSNNGNYNYGIKNLKNIYNFNNNNKKIFNFYSPKFDINPLEQHKNQNPNNNKTISGINSNIFNSTYNKIINGLNNKKIKIPIKNEYKIIKQPRNNSISVLHGENDESKSILINKKEKYPSLNKSGNKTRNLNKILNSKAKSIYPLTVKNNGYSIPKYVQREFHNNILNNSSSQNI